MFEVKKNITEAELKKVPISSLTVAIGDLLELVGGATTWTLVASTSKFFTRKAVAYEAATTAATELLVYELDGTETVEAEAANTANTAHNGDTMAATDEDTVNNSGTTVGTQVCVFIQSGIGKDTSHIVGRVLVGNSVDPLVAAA